MKDTTYEVTSRTGNYGGLILHEPHVDKSTNIAMEWAQWLHSIAQWTHCLTVLVKQHRPSEASLIKTVKHFDNVLNRLVYRKAHRQKIARLESIYSYGFGDQGDNPHFHACIAAPNLTRTELDQLIWSAAEKTRSAKYPIKIKPYENDGWIAYMMNQERHTCIYDLLIFPLRKVAS